MLNYCKEKWAKNEKLLQHYFERYNLNEEHEAKEDIWDYETLVRLIVRYIFNGDRGEYDYRWSEDIHAIDDGGYQGTILFLVHLDMYQPSDYEYLISSVYYGSCSGCDTLMAIQAGRESGKLSGQQIEDLMALCRDIVVNFKHPYDCYGDKTFCGMDFSEAEIEDADGHGGCNGDYCEI